MTRATIADVAARAGVTKSTVSHALSSKRPVAAETRLCIEQAIAELGFHPNPIAQRHAVGRWRALGFVHPLYAPQIAGYEMRFISAAANTVSQAGYAFVLLTQHDRADGALDPFFRSGLLDGVILMQVRRQDPRSAALQKARLPFVLIGRTADNTGLAYADIDIMAAMTRSVATSPSWATAISPACTRMIPNSASARLLAGDRVACAEYGLSGVVHPCGLSTEDGRQAMAAVLQDPPEVTGGDREERSRRVGGGAGGGRIPTDLSLVCHDQSNVGNLVLFHPTFVEVRPGELSRRAAEMLLAILAGTSDGEGILLAPGVTVGETSGVAPITAAHRRGPEAR